ncbi:LysR family transcriptional regulator [uncultured Xylophilus sp.]|uniref:LysR family transcriptional regulator n=1 Tax=uncultured Xylophilus sp. TaxID=296832 RepID=UPI0025F2EC1D|nr:LysR family transcriptional regulator [uncultured Xylophilus sp.]
MDLRDLKYFVALAEAGSTRRAAERVHRSQPALAKAIDRLEASLEAQLFERDGRGQRLSAAGVALLARAMPLIAAADAVRHDIGALGRGTAGVVRLGSGPLGAEYLLPRICGLMLAEAPDVQLQLTIRMNYELRDSLRDGTLDLVLGFVPEQEDEFACDTLLEDTVVAVAARGHPVFAQRRVRLETLGRYRWALPNAAVASRVWLDNAFAAHGLPPPVAQIETNSIPLVPQVIAHTELLSFVSRRTLRASGGLLQEIPLAATTLVRKFGLTYPKARVPSPAAARLVALLHAHGRSLFEGQDVPERRSSGAAGDIGT